MFVGSNAKKRSGAQQPTSTVTEIEVSESCLLEEWKNNCQDQEGCQQIIDNHLSVVVESLQNTELRQLALELLTQLTVDPINRRTVASYPNLMDQIEKLRMGSLSQKKLADEVYERLLDAFLMGQAMEITNPSNSNDIASIGEKKTHGRQAKIMARPAKTTTTTSDSLPKKVERPEREQAKSATVNLFVENMDEKVLGEIESCLLKCKGIISFFSDVEDGKVIVRLTSENLVDDVIASIYETTKHRTSVIKGDYDSSGFPLYITENQQKKGEGGGFFSSLYQIVSVSEVQNHPREKGKSGWLGSWW